MRNRNRNRYTRRPSTLRVWLEEIAAGVLLVVVMAAWFCLMYVLLA